MQPLSERRLSHGNSADDNDLELGHFQESLSLDRLIGRFRILRIGDPFSAPP
jgi:hypothetical protein